VRASSPSSKLRLAAVIVTLAATAVIAVLVACPPSVPRQHSGETVQEGGKPVRPGGEAAPARSSRSQPRRIEPQGMLAVILDDAGYSLPELQPFLELPGPLTVAVLPNLPHSTEAARRVLAAGKDLILHCPMEAEGEEDPGPGALRVGMSGAQIDRQLAADFASVPGAAGMNNHMGSLATADPALMEAVLSYLKGTGRYFVDSRTTADTVGPALAQRLGVPFLQRNFFVDDERSEKAIASAFQAGVRQARTRGAAVVIGHVQNREVLDILRAGEKDLADNGVRLARLTEIMSENRAGEGDF
jgi:uncharacterized protein